MYLIGLSLQVGCLVASTSLQVVFSLSLGADNGVGMVSALCLALVPIVLINLFSLLWTYGTVDFSGRRAAEAVCVVSHLFQGGIVWRYGKLLLGRDDKELRDMAILRLLHTSLQDAPFAVLAGGVMISRGEGSALGVAAVASSLLSLSVAYTCPVGTKPLDNTGHQSISTTCNRYTAHKTLQFISHLFLLGARLLAAICFVSAIGYWIFLTVGLHFLVCGCFVLGRFIQLTITKGKGSDYRVLILQIYDTIDLFKLGRGVAIFYYALVAVENLAMTFIWLAEVGYSLRNILISVAIICAFVMGLILCLIKEKCTPLKPNLAGEGRKTEDKRRILVNKSPSKTLAGHTNVAMECQEDDMFSQTLSVDVMQASTPDRNIGDGNGASVSGPTSPISSDSPRRELTFKSQGSPSELQDSGYLSRVETPPLTETDIESIVCVVDMAHLLGPPIVKGGLNDPTRADNKCRHKNTEEQEQMCIECQVDILYITGKSCTDSILDIDKLECEGEEGIGEKHTDDLLDIPLFTKAEPLLDEVIHTEESDRQLVDSPPGVCPPVSTCEMPLSQGPPATEAAPNRAWADFSSTSSDSSRPGRRRVRRLRSLPSRRRPVAAVGSEDSESLTTDSCSLTYCDICGHSPPPSDTSSEDSDWDQTSEEFALTWPPRRRLAPAHLPTDAVNPNDHVTAWLEKVCQGDNDVIIRRDSMQGAIDNQVSHSVRGLFPRTLESRTKKGKCIRGQWKDKHASRSNRKSAKHILLRFCSFSGRKTTPSSVRNRQAINSVSETVDFVFTDTCNVGQESCV